jgi:AraC-like DNA-binding protein
MRDIDAEFRNSLFPFVATKLARHRNPVTCILFGLDGPLRVRSVAEKIEGEILSVRPGVDHEVEVWGRAKVLYFDCLQFPFEVPLAGPLPRDMIAMAEDASTGNEAAIRELRARLERQDNHCSPDLARALRRIEEDSSMRMSQTELAFELRMERTKALRYFRSVTGLTFRGWKNWIGLQAAAREILRGGLIRSAAMDGGFADNAHLTRSFRASFGTTPSAAVARGTGSAGTARLFNV